MTELQRQDPQVFTEKRGFSYILWKTNCQWTELSPMKEQMSLKV